ncbi:MAG: 2Fe-2S iron-sulfur cluster-binding protein [Myxococcota bacterium]
MPVEVCFLTTAGEVRVRVNRGASVLAAVKRAQLPLGQSCRGVGVCAMCRVRVCSGALRAPDALEARLLARDDVRPGERFACRARLLGDAVVTTSYW